MTIEIKLTQRQVTLIDDIDADLAGFKWYAQSRTGGFRAVRASAGPNRVTIYLHRIILERMTGRPLAKTEFTDHIDGNPLNNHRSNLRIATHAENMRNRGKNRNNKSGFKGVFWECARGEWRAQIRTNRKLKHLGYFETPELAYAAYCTAARELHGEFANTGA